jgi:twitching motility protein PilT
MNLGDGFIKQILQFAVDNNASDVHFSSGMQPLLRIKGELKKVDMPPTHDEALRKELATFLHEYQKKKFNKFEEIDFAFTLDGIARFRVNIFEHFEGMSAAFRVIPTTIPTIDDLVLPKVIKEFTNRKKGLILVTGPTGCGKSTTLAAMLNQINEERRGHIITIEDPAEYLHTPKQCLIHQREVNVHTKNFASALRSCLREDPDVILVGEMRDLETISLALHTAETGHLVLSTLHTNTAAESVDRIVDVFPAERQQQIRVILANTLVGIIAQRLVPMAYKNDRVALVEILVATPSIQNLIREGKSYQIQSVIQTGADHGMQTFDRSFDKLQKNNVISPQLKLTDFV